MLRLGGMVALCASVALPGFAAGQVVARAGEGAPVDTRSTVPPDTAAADYEDGYFDLFVERMPERAHLVTLVDDAGRVLVPLGAVLGHVAIPAVAIADSLVLEWPPDVWRTVVAVGDRTVITSDSTVTYAPDEWVARNGELFLSDRALADVLRARVEIRFPDLMIVVSDNPDFPSILRAKDLANRERATSDQVLSPVDPFAEVPYPDRTGGVAGGWGVSVSDGGGPIHGTYRFAMGGSVLGGATEAEVSGLVSEFESARSTELFVRHTRVFLDSDWVRRLDLGSVVTEGTVARRVTGFTLTNAPLTTPRYFDDAVIAPAVPAGWEYEVYQGEHLVGVGGGDGPGEIQAPIGYGNTPVRVRLIGPAGQESEQDLVYVVPSARVPTGTWRYAVGGGACRDAFCDGYWFGQVNHGLTSRLTTGIGADYLHGSGATSLSPYAQVLFAPRPNLSMELQARPSSYLRAGAHWVRGQVATAAASYAWAGGDAPDLGFVGWSGQLTGGGRLPGLGGQWVSGRLMMRGLDRSEIDSWQASLSTTIHRTHVALGMESGLQPGTIGTARVMHTLVGYRPGGFDDLSFLAGVGAGPHGLELGELGVTARTWTHTQIDARVRFRRGEQPTFTLGASVRSVLGFFRARGSQGGGTGRAAGYLAADGGLSYGRFAGWEATNTLPVGLAGIVGQAFFDNNGNGTREIFEGPVIDAVVRISGRQARTGPDGRFQVWGLTPYEGARISVDPMSIPLGWAVSQADRLVRPSPNMFTRVDLAVGATREVIGSVLSEREGGRPVGGVLVEILDAEGVVVAEGRTYSDGVYYIESVRPGTYRARIGTPSIPRIGGHIGGSDPVEITFRVPRTPGDPVEVPPLTLYR